jgi:hypothetical protein
MIQIIHCNFIETISGRISQFYRILVFQINYWRIDWIKIINCYLVFMSISLLAIRRFKLKLNKKLSSFLIKINIDIVFLFKIITFIF